MAEQTYIKVLLAPAWEHNYPDGPSEWLDNVQTGSAPFSATSAPHFHTKTGRKAQTGDKYYRTPNGGQSSADMKYVDNGGPRGMKMLYPLLFMYLTLILVFLMLAVIYKPLLQVLVQVVLGPPRMRKDILKIE